MEPVLIISSILLWILIGFNFLITLALVRKVNTLQQFGGMPKPDMLDVGTRAPEFTVLRLDNQQVTHADYDNEERIMVFISSGCRPCRDQMPVLQDLYPKARRSGVELMIINLDDLKTTQKFAEETQFQAPLLSAPRDENPLNEVYKIPGTPSYYQIDATGTIVSAGFLDAEWEKLIAQWN